MCEVERTNRIRTLGFYETTDGSKAEVVAIKDGIAYQEYRLQEDRTLGV